MVVTEIAKGKELVWKLLSSPGRFAGAAYNSLADAGELARQLGVDLFQEDDLTAGAERARRLTETLRGARVALGHLEEERGIDLGTAAQHLDLALAVLKKLAEDISPETFGDEI